MGELDRTIREGIAAIGYPGQPSHPICHGVGARAHEPPYPHQAGGGVFEEGMVLAVEPMVTAGRHMVRMGDDGWAIYSQDGSLAAHFEFTVAITAEGPRVLTPWHEAKAAAAA